MHDFLCIDKLDDTVNKCNNTYHSTIKMKPVNIKSSTDIDSNKENNNEDPKSKIDDHVRISKLNDLNGEEIFGTFYKKELQKTNQKEFIVEKVIRQKVINYILNGKVMTICLIAG